MVPILTNKLVLRTLISGPDSNKYTKGTFGILMNGDYDWNCNIYYLE